MDRTKGFHGCLLMLLWSFRGAEGSKMDCQDPGSPRCTISSEKLLERAIQHAELIYLVSEESVALFEDMFIPFNVQTSLTRTGNLCTTSTLPFPSSISKVQLNSDKWLLHSVAFLVRFWIDPVISLQMSLDLNENAPVALINKTKWMSAKLVNLEQGLAILMKKMFGEEALLLQQNETLVDPVRSDMVESVLRDYTLLSCFKKDSHKIETFLKLLKCRQTGGLGCSPL